MNQLTLYTPVSSFFSSRFNGRKVQKLPVNAGFTCPVRDGKLSKSGCAFCNGKSFVPSYCIQGDNIATQLHKGRDFFARKFNADAQPVYLAYFQSATNTYASVSDLNAFYRQAINLDFIQGVVVSTRPDCIDSSIVDLLSLLQRETFVMVELGCESFSDRVLTSLGRGHNVSQLCSAVGLLQASFIPVSLHLILGLPGEAPDYVVKTAHALNELNVDAVKLHQLQIVKGSAYARLYAHNPLSFKLYTPETYVSDVCDILENLQPSLAIDRFVSETPSVDLIAPKWGLKPDLIKHSVINELQRRKTYQGFCLQ